MADWNWDRFGDDDDEAEEEEESFRPVSDVIGKSFLTFFTDIVHET